MTPGRLFKDADVVVKVLPFFPSRLAPPLPPMIHHGPDFWSWLLTWWKRWSRFRGESVGSEIVKRAWRPLVDATRKGSRLPRRPQRLYSCFVWAVWYSWFDFPLLCNLMCQPDVTPEHLVLKSIWNDLNPQILWAWNSGQEHFPYLLKSHSSPV